MERDKRVVGRFTISNQTESRGQLLALRDEEFRNAPRACFTNANSGPCKILPQPLVMLEYAAIPQL